MIKNHCGLTEVIEYWHVAIKMEALDSLVGIFVVLKAFIIGQKNPSIIIAVPALGALYLPLSSIPPLTPPARSSQTIPAKKAPGTRYLSNCFHLLIHQLL